MPRTIVYFHVYIILDLPITYRNASVLCQCTCLHIAVNMIAFYVKRNENIYPTGRALMKMYRVVPQTKRANGITHYNAVVGFHGKKQRYNGPRYIHANVVQNL